MLNVCGLLDIKVAIASSVGMHERVKHGGLQCDGCDFRLNERSGGTSTRGDKIGVSFVHKYKRKK